MKHFTFPLLVLVLLLFAWISDVAYDNQRQHTSDMRATQIVILDPVEQAEYDRFIQNKGRYMSLYAKQVTCTEKGSYCWNIGDRHIEYTLYNKWDSHLSILSAEIYYDDNTRLGCKARTGAYSQDNVVGACLNEVPELRAKPIKICFQMMLSTHDQHDDYSRIPFEHCAEISR